ncbi:MAG: hypothetical protein HYV34_03450 [Candidatus Kerfeldbacteria bacterium]|nr:hypothetical protein [Candidatus Kerfeldbacteria bacterium]
MKISLIQINASEEKKENFEKAKGYFVKAAKDHPDIICLPENFLYSGDDKLKEAEELSSDHIQEFQRLAKTHRVNLVLGSIALLVPSKKKVTNSSLIIGRNGEIIHRYDKLYTYDVEREDFAYRESDTVKPGNQLGLFEIDGVTIGVGICFDLRFPEYFRVLVQRGAEIIFLPSNFYKITGEVTWDILTKARAIENQVYMCACDQTGRIHSQERCGNTRVVSFDGTILAEQRKAEGFISADLNLEHLRQFRKHFPVLQQMKS